MDELQEFDRYMAHLNEGLGHADRHAGLRGYCTGLMSPLQRKSVEPMAAHIDPMKVRSRHQSLHHFVADAHWSDEQMLLRVCQWVVPKMDFAGGGWWIIDDTGFPKQGRHSVGVARQYCGMLGKQDNCQVAVSVSLACEKAGVPEALRFATKPQLALQQIEHLMGQGAPRHCVLADAGYGVDTAFRERLSELGLRYAVGVTGSVTVWPPGREPLPPPAYSGRGNVPTRLRLGGKALPRHQPQSIKELAMELGPEHWHTVTWREGTNAMLSSRLARVRVRPAHRDSWRDELRPPEWLLIEWPKGDAEPLKYWLSTLPEDMALERMVFEAKMRWRIERDYQDLKQDLGLGHYEGRGWRGFHHHASLSIAAYGFLLAQRLQHPDEVGGKKNSAQRQTPALPTHYKPRGSPAG
ncbi:MAG: IS701 family transposase, partial [Polaromonas sp.]